MPSSRKHDPYVFVPVRGGTYIRRGKIETVYVVIEKGDNEWKTFHSSSREATKALGGNLDDLKIEKGFRVPNMKRTDFHSGVSIRGASSGLADKNKPYIFVPADGGMFSRRGHLWSVWVVTDINGKWVDAYSSKTLAREGAGGSLDMIEEGSVTAVMRDRDWQ